MEDKWFKKGFKHTKFYSEDDNIFSLKDEEIDDDCIAYASDQSAYESESESDGKRRSRPANLNAFDLISFSPGFSLSGLFEDGSKESRFVTGAPVSKIVSKLEEIAKVVSFSMRKKDCRISLEGSREGVKGPLTITVEIFELTPKLRVVEVKKKAGDKGEYEEFCERELRPGLRPLMLPGTCEPSRLVPGPDEERNKG
ncbi:hypothetical protein L2E82_39928 [Cichorium intybus]|uniref:Uncharacterized protein n=1 Tax=Cichorium intybus TaxID=13427 RepID=A0ACB9AKJ8_CICIN|nr:hypothetical protein L2E82_39928 [Cichorium intybus]